MALTGTGRNPDMGWALAQIQYFNAPGISVLVKKVAEVNIEPWRDWWNFDVPVTASAVKMDHYRRLREG